MDYSEFFDKRYIQQIVESRYKTLGLNEVDSYIPRLIKNFGIKEFSINYFPNDKFNIAIYSNNFNDNKFQILLKTCELLGYFPSIIEIDYVDIFQKFKDEKGKNFLEWLKKLKFNLNEKFYIEFEAWKDLEIESIPDKLYHVYNIRNLTKINNSGLIPKNKSKKSYHPHRIYLTFTYDSAVLIKSYLEEFELGENFNIIEIDTNKKTLYGNCLKDILILRKDPNFIDGYYTEQNIPKEYLYIL